MPRKTLITMWHKCCAKIILNKTPFRIPLLWKPWHFELYVWSSLLARFRVKDRNYLSVRFIFRISGFSWLVKNRARFGSAQNTQLLEVFFSRTELLALAVVDSVVVVGQKRDWDETRSSSVALRDFCSRPIQACSVEQFPHLLIGNWFLMDYAGNYPCFPAAFTNAYALIIYLPDQR